MCSTNRSFDFVGKARVGGRDRDEDPAGSDEDEPAEVMV
jgi:hypothetical protein